MNPTDWVNQLRGGGMPGNNSVANPSDPSQLRNWGLGIAQENANRQYMTPDLLAQYKSMLSPFFQQQQNAFTGSFNNQLNSQMGQAQNQAGAYAAFKGLNPLSYTQSAGQGVRQQMNPQYFSGLGNMLGNQGQQLLDTTGRASQFQDQNAQEYARMLMNGSQQAQQTWDQPGFWDYALGALGAGAGTLLGGPVGGMLGWNVGKGVGSGIG